VHRSVRYSQEDTQIDGLAGRIAGEVLVPGVPGYESARKPAMARWHDIRPRAVVICESASDVAEALAFARRSGVHVAPRSGGHCFAGRSSTPGIVIDVSPMSSVSVADGVATVGAGTRLADLYDALDENGRTIPAGCGPTVGIAGLTLGGGLGILGRKHGLTCDRLVAAQVVLADGRVVDCDEQRHADLFWALRGAGGGQFGVVTSLAFETVPAPAATTFHLVWPAGDAAAVIEAWQNWAPDAPDELYASLQLTAARARDDALVVNLFGAMLGLESDTVELLDGLVARVGADPEAASHRHQPYRAAKQALVGLGAAEEAEADQPRLMFSKSEFFRRPLPADTIAALVRTLGHGRGRGESRELNFTPLGGAYNRVPADATGFAHRDERYLIEHVLVADTDAPTAGREWVARSWAMVHRWGSGRVYPNFPDPELANWPEAYYGGNYERLLRVKRTYDPDNLFRFAEQSLGSLPADEGAPAAV
jgi:FAD/FMN-containing dehydrogenase